MTDILKEIAEDTRKRVESCKLRIPMSQMVSESEKLEKDTGFPFEKALSEDGISLICEIKRASPSKGIIAEDFPYMDIARDYDQGGASCISVLTEPRWFLGSDDYLRQIAASVVLHSWPTEP